MNSSNLPSLEITWTTTLQHWPHYLARIPSVMSQMWNWNSFQDRATQDHLPHSPRLQSPPVQPESLFWLQAWRSCEAEVVRMVTSKPLTMRLTTSHHTRTMMIPTPSLEKLSTCRWMGPQLREAPGKHQVASRGTTMMTMTMTTNSRMSHSMIVTKTSQDDRSLTPCWTVASCPKILTRTIAIFHSYAYHHIMNVDDKQKILFS
mmetsp:Transcript_40008/g.96597  ORF Transcript_40008/g.96597 Transcript_40008/m.96597 type:complete len:204 (+) Transcript_40008:608-1219(+)